MKTRIETAKKGQIMSTMEKLKRAIHENKD